MDSPPIISDNSEIASESPRMEVRGDSHFVDDSKQAEFYKCFGQRLKAERERVGMTQEAVAGRAGINRSYLSQIESGKRRVSLYLACRLAMVFDKELETFLE